MITIKRLRVAGFATLLSVAAFSGSAQAATISTDQACYKVYRFSNSVVSDQVGLTASGFLASAPFTAKLDGNPFGSGTTAVDGSYSGAFDAPTTIAEGAKYETRTLSLTDSLNGVDQNTAETNFAVSNFEANISPSTGNLLKKKVRFKALGFGQAKTVYVHYLDPKGKFRKTVKLGKTKGICGDLTSKKMRALPVKNPRKGRWILQFDTAKKYSKKTLLAYLAAIDVRIVRSSSVVTKGISDATVTTQGFAKKAL